jgi:transposase
VLEDGAPAHSCKQAQQARKNLDIKNLIHPPSSPDLNPIENAWHLLKMKVSQLPVRATNLDQLWEQVQDCWRDIPIEFINRLIDGMEDRLEAVTQANGGSTAF